MGNKKRTKATAYVQEALESFRDYLLEVREQDKEKRKGILKFKVTLTNLQKALEALPKEDREIIERFWGMKGGINHSKKIGHSKTTDKAFMDLCAKTDNALKKMFKLEFVRIYDEEFENMIHRVSRKIDKGGDDISDFEAVKYLMAFLIVIKNGPKLSVETNPMSIRTDIDKNCHMDEYQALKEMGEIFEDFQDKSINIRLIKSIFDMINLQDAVTLKVNFGIGTSQIFDPAEISVLKYLGINVSEIFSSDSIEQLEVFYQIRAFKERVFKYGAWNVASQIVLGRNINTKEFMEVVGTIYKERDPVSRMEEFKTGQKNQLRVLEEVRVLEVYCIGGLEFTDPTEIEFLYLNRNLFS